VNLTGIVTFLPAKILLTYRVERPRTRGEPTEQAILNDMREYEHRCAEMMPAVRKLQDLLVLEPEMNDDDQPFRYIDQITAMECRLSGNDKVVILEAIVVTSIDDEKVSFEQFFERLTNELSELGLAYGWLSP